MHKFYTMSLQKRKINEKKTGRRRAKERSKKIGKEYGREKENSQEIETELSRMCTYKGRKI